ncbi:helix-turn-helix transcriptional regulator [Nodularia sphaerocarpa]|uniref:helix-turn-helix transcriptional regulator n=1 Tax=Nodularia sphaerocarpa TaxID=137816 RepID=UPI001EFA4E19|nr:AraC family transcriptional regulator [Nodularia sphaerocarpa]MDB9372629.1 AraC family transcriptional regulator [Nodularia sphaerocarpa CS-585]MDB9378842.1 AraC family transcriptional regulator [Nodularia sphaerocarpa CS-585A2]
MALQQLLGCPYQGNTKRVYLESKVWELMALQVDQFLEIQTVETTSKSLNAEDIERIHYASEILLKRLDQPPSLMELARMVGINDNKLKVGFKQVFETTVFGYLHDCRMERSRQMLAAGRLTVTEAAKAVVFANRGYFAASFRRKFGVNPGIYLNDKRQKVKNSV